MKGPSAMSGHEDKDHDPPGTSKEAEEFTMDHGTGQTLTIPTADAVVDPRDGGKAWCSVFVVVILTSLMEALIFLQQPTLYYMKNTNISSGGDEEIRWLLPSNPPADVLTVLDTYKALFSISGILSGTLTVLIGYRWVALIGSVLTAVGYLGAAFSDHSNVPLISFLYGALPGIGHNLIVVANITAILQRLRRRRLVALLIPHASATLGSTAVYLMLQYGSLGINSWKGYLLLQAGAASFMIPASLFLKPRNARITGQANQSLLSYVMGMDELKVFRSILLYVFAAVCCLWDGGISVIEAKLPSVKDQLWFLPAGQLLHIILLASLLGTCCSCCISSNIRLRSVVIAMVVFGGILFLLNMMASLLYNCIYAICYSILVGVIKGLGKPLLEYLIPLLLGENNAAVGAAIMTFGQGIGSLSMPAIANEIENSMKKVDGCFYFAGVIFFLSASFIILSYRLHLRAITWVVTMDHPGEKSTQEPQCSGVDMERF